MNNKNDDGFIKVIDWGDNNALLIEALNHGNTFTTQRESKMLMEIKGVSISARPRSDGRFQGYVRQNGKKKYFYGKSAAEVNLQIKNFIQGGNPPKKKERKTVAVPTFTEYANKWLRLYKAPNLKPTSLDRIGRQLRPAHKALGERKLNTITTDNLQELLLQIKGERSRDLMRLVLNQIFTKARIQGLVKNNPCEGIELKKHKQKKRNGLTIQEQQLFIDYIKGTSHELLCLFLLATGTRIGEALAVTKDDIDFNNGTVHIGKNVVFIAKERIDQNEPKTEAAVRDIPIPADLCERLRGVDTHLLFPYTYNKVNLYFQRVSKAINIHVTAHLLRHTYSDRLEEAGVPPKVKQYLLGHASLDMTQNRYTDTQWHYVTRFLDEIKSALTPKI